MDPLSLARLRTVLVGVVALFCGGMILLYAKSVIQPLLLAFFACLIQLALREHPYFKQWSRMMDAKASDRTRILCPDPAAGPPPPGTGTPASS